MEYVRYKNHVEAGHKVYTCYRCHISPARFEHIATKSRGSSSIDHAINVISKPVVWKTHDIWITCQHLIRNTYVFKTCTCALNQCFSTAGPRPGTGLGHQLYRAERGLRKLQ